MSVAPPSSRDVKLEKKQKLDAAAIQHLNSRVQDESSARQRLNIAVAHDQVCQRQPLIPNDMHK
eukprot:6973800-Pyramimonas_sp.AAC.1